MIKGSQFVFVFSLLWGCSDNSTDLVKRIIEANTALNAALSSDATLSALTVSEGDLNPKFTLKTTAYAVSIGSKTNKLKVIPTPDDINSIVMINGIKQIPGNESPTLDMEIGLNTVSIVVIAPNGTKQTYILSVTRGKSSDATLAALNLSEGSLTPNFEKATTTYATSIANSTKTITITPTVSDPHASVAVGGIAIEPDKSSKDLEIEVGENTIPIVVTAEDGSTKTYSLALTRAASSNAALSSLSLNNGSLTPNFDLATFAYTATIPHAVDKITITPSAADAHASISVNGIETASGASSAVIAMEVGVNVVTVVVTAQNGSTNTYTLTLTREKSSDATLSSLSLSSGSLSPGFNLTTTSYTASIANSVSSITVTPMLSNAFATVKINSEEVISGSASQAILMNTGSNTVTVAVTAQDGTINTYLVTVTRAQSSDATLASLSLSSGSLSPNFASATTSYTASIDNTVNSIFVTPILNETHAIVKVNGITTASGNPSAPISMSVGANTVTIIVTAEDSSTNTYILTVTRSQSADATLSALSLSSGSLNPSFSAGNSAYTVSLANTANSITVTPLVNEATATVTVNGIAVPAGSASAAISMNVGVNAITIVVTAQNGTTKTYDLTLTRAQSADATLSSLSLSNSSLIQTFSPSTTAYNASIDFTVASITVTPTVHEANATISVNGVSTTSGNASQALSMNLGANAVTIIVTAQDGSIETYVITVTRGPSSDATLSNLSLSSGSLSPSFSTSTTSYTASIANTMNAITVTPTVNEPNATVTVNGVTTTSAHASSSFNMNIGINTLTVVVTAQDGSTNTYTVAVTRPESSDANLASLVLSSGSLSPSFAADTTSYSVSVANAVTSITVTPTVNEANATVAVAGISTTSGNASSAISLSVGQNQVTVLVTAQDGSTKTYTLQITRAASSNANLASLTISSGSLSPSFAFDTLVYTTSIDSTVSSVTITPTVDDANATVTVNSASTTSGNASSALTVNFGSNTAIITVTAQNGSTKNYIITIERGLSADATLSALSLSSGSLNPSFAASTASYTSSIANTVTSITLTPTVNESYASVRVSGTNVTSGNASQAIAMNVGQNTVTVVVTAQNGSTNTYTFTITRAESADATLSSLSLTSGSLSPSFNASTASYTASIANTVTSITLTPTVNEPNATVKVNGTNTISGNASQAITMSVGSNTVTVVVTAQNGTTGTYTVTITRAQSSDATLSSLLLSSGSLSPSFSASTTSYTSSIANTVTSITVTPIVNEANATVTVSGISTTSGNASSGITMNIGSNTVTIVVTAQNGATNTYTVTVTRPQSSDASLSSLSISSGSLSPSFAADTTSYAVAITNATSFVLVTPTVSESHASLTINGNSATSGNASSSLSMNVGVNTISIIVTAQNGTTNTYTLTVTRAQSSDATLSSLSFSGGSMTPSFSSSTTSYTASINNSINSITVTPTVNDSSATVKVNNVSTTSGNTSAAISIVVGTNTVNIVVTAQNGATKTYTLTVTKAGLFTTFQAASLVIGQSDFTTAVASPDTRTPTSGITNEPFTNPTVINDILYLPDFKNNRILGFNSFPSANGATANFVLGQSSFTSSTSGTSNILFSSPMSPISIGGKFLIVDRTNNRVLVWNSIPTANTAADVVIGQTDMTSNSSGCSDAKFNRPLSIATANGKLIVSDLLNNRIMIWNSVPTTNGKVADVVLGHSDFITCTASNGSSGMNAPRGIYSDGTRLFVSDSSNNRVLVWNTIPTVSNTAASFVLGQSDFVTYTSGCDSSSFNSPYFITGSKYSLAVVDRNNHRVLIWNSIPTITDTPADVVLGKADMNTSAQSGIISNKYMNLPQGAYYNGLNQLMVGDDLNFRWLVFNAQ